MQGCRALHLIHDTPQFRDKRGVQAGGGGRLIQAPYPSTGIPWGHHGVTHRTGTGRAPGRHRRVPRHCQCHPQGTASGSLCPQLLCPRWWPHQCPWGCLSVPGGVPVALWVALEVSPVALGVSLEVSSVSGSAPVALEVSWWLWQCPSGSGNVPGGVAVTLGVTQWPWRCPSGSVGVPGGVPVTLEVSQ